MHTPGAARAERDGHRVAVDEHETKRRIHHHARADVLEAGDAVDLIRDVEEDAHERGGDRLDFGRPRSGRGEVTRTAPRRGCCSRARSDPRPLHKKSRQAL